MENQTNSSEKPEKGGGLLFFIDFLVAFYSDLVSNPLRSGLVYFVAGLVPALFAGWILFPMVLYSEQPQPVNFSHIIHMDEELVDGVEGDEEQEKCLYCHQFRDDGTFVGIPKLENCLECHDDPESPLGESEEEKKFMAEHVAEEKEIPWLSYYRQPDHVYFSHIAMVKMGEIECQFCHGDHNEIDQLPVHQKNRLTGYSIKIWGERISGYKSNSWDRMKMDDCADCHIEKEVAENNACFVCHK